MNLQKKFSKHFDFFRYERKNKRKFIQSKRKKYDLCSSRGGDAIGSIQQQQFSLFDSYYVKSIRKRQLIYKQKQTIITYFTILQVTANELIKNKKKRKKWGKKRESILAENSIEMGEKTGFFF